MHSRGFLPPYEDHEYTITAEEGELVCFPSYLQHMVSSSTYNKAIHGLEGGEDPNISFTCALGDDNTLLSNDIEFLQKQTEEAGKLIFALQFEFIASSI